jgi:YihY family inner membrane protein
MGTSPFGVNLTGMNPIERAARAFDRYHEGHRWLAFPYAVLKKYGDDQGGGLAAQLTYYGFLAVFPLLLVLSTLLGLLLRHDPSLQQRIVGTALAQLPIIGTQIRRNIHAFPGSGLALAFGMAGALYGALGSVRVAQTAMNTVWDIPRKRWPNFVFSIGRSLLMLVAFAVLIASSTLVSGLIAGASALTRIFVVPLGLAVNLLLFTAAFQILTARRLRWREMWVGALLAAVVWTILQSFGGLYVAHTLRNSTELYGFFGVVIALLIWIYLGCEILLYAAEINVVRAKRLWPRRIVQPPINEGDERAMRGYAGREERRPEEHIEVRFDPEAKGDGR